MGKKPKTSARRGERTGQASHRGVVQVPRSKIPWLTQITLFVRTGGRCEFSGCNKYLLEHSLTLTPGNFSQHAHIVSLSPRGPRAHDGRRPANLHGADNLMLLCAECHKLIDDQSQQYGRRTLERHKHDHEARIRHLTGLGPELKTTIVQMKAKISGKTVAIPVSQVIDAVSPRYPEDTVGHVIDLTNIDGSGTAFYNVACETIRNTLSRVFGARLKGEKPPHVSLFALGPIPLLVFLGATLSDKLAVDLFQFHRDTKDWKWKEGGEAVEFEFVRRRHGTDPANVALLLSVSGTIRFEDLPDTIDDSFSVYELGLRGRGPTPTVLRTRRDLANFRTSYHEFLSAVHRDHGAIDAIHLFPAVPAPIAVLCGHEPLHKVHPSLLVYDYDKGRGGFTYHLRIN